MSHRLVLEHFPMVASVVEASAVPRLPILTEGIPEFRPPPPNMMSFWKFLGAMLKSPELFSASSRDECWFLRSPGQSWWDSVPLCAIWGLTKGAAKSDGDAETDVDVLWKIYCTSIHPTRVLAIADMGYFCQRWALNVFSIFLEVQIMVQIVPSLNLFHASSMNCSWTWERLFVAVLLICWES